MKSYSTIMIFLIFGSLALSSCSDPKDPPLGVSSSVSVHPAAWIQKSSSEFHGAALESSNYDAASCQQCHGNNYDGGLVDVSCYTCHSNFPHPAGWTGLGDASHSKYIQANNYDFRSCKSCHGEDYSAVKVDNSCRTCHTNEAGPEACNTCHGVFAAADELGNAVPPAGLNNETDPSDPAIGAHQPHIAFFGSAEAACQECHIVPATMTDIGHIDGDGQAEAVFNGPLGSTVSENGARQPSQTGAYSGQTLTCENTYCHGNWGLLKSSSSNDFIYAADKIEGNNASPNWTDPNAAACGTCHDLPPKGHTPFGVQACSNCHSSVIDRAGNIIDASKHVNGKINVFGQEVPMF